MNLFTAKETILNYAKAGANKTNLSIKKMILLGIMAGFFIAMGGAVANTATHGVTNAGLAKLLSGLLFPFGLAMVILTGSELFTGNTLISISVMDEKTTLLGMLKNWLFVYFGNAIGAIVVAAGCAFLGQLNCSGGNLALYTMKVAAGKCSLSWFNAVGLGFFCNVLVTVGVLLSLSAKDVTGRVLGAYLPVSFFVICGFEHSVANMFYVPAGIFASHIEKYALLAAAQNLDVSMLSWTSFATNNLVPVTVGNIIGGIIVGGVFWVCYGQKEQVDLVENDNMEKHKNISAQLFEMR